MRLLVVDDKIDNTELLTQILEEQFEVQSAHSGEECLKIAKATLPDLIILDVTMPKMDGYQVLSHLKQDPLTENIPIVFLTARYRDIDRVVKGLELGAIDYLTKPIEEDELLARIKVALRTKESEDRIRLQNIELKALNDELSALSHSVSHDLRAPLRHIDGMSRILLEDYSDSLNDKAKNYLKRIISANSHMKECLENLLSLSKVSSTQFYPQKINLSELARKIANNFAQNDGYQHVVIEIQPDLMALADKNLLYLILLNLIGNSLKFSSKQEHPKIKIGLKKDKDQFIYYVNDNGVGFDMNNSQQVFAPFQRLHSQEEFEGSGIGLSIAQRAVHRHGGSIWADSQLGQGCTLFFTLSQTTNIRYITDANTQDEVTSVS